MTDDEIAGESGFGSPSLPEQKPIHRSNGEEL